MWEEIYLKKYCGVFKSCHWSLACDIIMRLWKPTPIASCCLRLGLSLCFREAVGWWESSWIQLFPTTWPFFQLVGSGYSELYLFSRFLVWTFGIWWSSIFYLFTSFVCVLLMSVCSFLHFNCYTFYQVHLLVLFAFVLVYFTPLVVYINCTQWGNHLDFT